MSGAIWIATYQIGTREPVVLTAYEKLDRAKRACQGVADEYSVGRHLVWRRPGKWNPGGWMARKANMTFRLYSRILNGIED